MTEIEYIKADATLPQSEGNIIITHICNDIGGWGKGFVLALSSDGKLLKSSIESGIKIKMASP